MSKIKLLSKELIAKIAAGEVVESSASVVKELVENAIDAGAMHIKIDVEDSGFRRIAITDDGVGMNKADLINSVKLHATSKIVTQDDLFRISTLGFRGEALATISEVSDFSIKSKTDTANFGYQLETYNDDFSLAEIAMNRGTVINVRNLFSRTPARLKFMKSKSYEFRKIVQIVTNMSLLFPSVSLRLTHNGKEILSFLGGDSLNTRVRTVMGSDMAKHLLEFETEDTYLKIKGYLGRPQISSKTTSRQLIFINNRAVRHPAIARRIKDTYQTLLAPREQPAFILFIDLPVQNIDVNIHPRKEEIKMLNQREILDSIEKIVEIILKNNDLRYYLDGQDEETDYDLHGAAILKDKSNLWTVKERDYTNAEIIQVHNTYLITETKEGLMLIDQHAAHERILFEELKENYKEMDMKSCTLDEVISFELPKVEADFLLENIKEFSNLGFIIEDFGKNKFLLSVVPEFFKTRDLVALIKEVLDDLQLGRKPLGLDYKTERTMAYLACRTAIKAGDFLTMDERRRLLDKLQKTKINYTCPHGRPSHIELGKHEIESMFKRR